MLQFSNPKVALAYEVASKDMRKYEREEKENQNFFESEVVPSESLTLLISGNETNSNESQVFNFVKDCFTSNERMLAFS